MVKSLAKLILNEGFLHRLFDNFGVILKVEDISQVRECACLYAWV